MNYLTFGKEHYHLHCEMEDWCEKYFGQGKWIFDRFPKDWTGLPNWTVHSMFGNTTFAFKDAKHYTLFVLRWAQ